MKGHPVLCRGLVRLQDLVELTVNPDKIHRKGAELIFRSPLDEILRLVVLEYSE